MKLLSLELEQFRKFDRPVRLSGFTDGLNVLCGPNEFGKSTVLAEIRGLLFERHNSKADPIKRMQTRRGNAAPRIAMDFALGGDKWRIEKRFLHQPMACLTGPAGSRFDGEAAEEELQRLLGFGTPSKQGARLEHMGVWRALWVTQRDSVLQADLSSDLARSTITSCLDTEVGVLTGSENDEGIFLERTRKSINRLIYRRSRHAGSATAPLSIASGSGIKCSGGCVPGNRAVSMSRRLVMAEAAALLMPLRAWPQTREETLRVVSGSTINTLDPTLLGATPQSIAFGLNVYDRLVTFARKTVNGHLVFDLSQPRGELAESFIVSPDGLSIAFKLRRGGTFHDGSPVTVQDVKWSLDRAVLAKSGAAAQLATGSLTRPEQFAITGDNSFRVTLDRPDRLALPNLATPFARIINSTLAKAHATPDDPWATAWLTGNEAGGGAYAVENFAPGEQVVLRRNDNWKNGEGGKLPYFQRVILRVVPEAATRASLIARGDADIAIDLQISDVISLEQRGMVKVISNPQTDAFTFLAFNTRKPPFDNVTVRRAIAAALPYDSMFKAAIYGRGAPMFGATWPGGEPPDATFPQPMPLHTDTALAKRLLAEAGLAGGFKTWLAFSAGNAATAEPVAALAQEALGAIGVDVDIRKLPDAQEAALETDKTFDMIIGGSAAYLPATDYFFRIFYEGETRWNYGGWNNTQIAALTRQARFERDPAVYDGLARRMIALAAADLPMIILWQPSQEAVMAKTIGGFTYWFHRQIDERDLYRG